MKYQATSLTFVIIDKEEDFLALESCWDALLEQSEVRTPFLTWDWVSLWWSFYRESLALRVGVVRDSSGGIVGIAPFVLGRGVDGARRYLRHLFFMGGMGDIAAEGLDFIIARGEESRVAPLLTQVFSNHRAELDLVEISALHAESPNAPFLQRSMSEMGAVEHRFAPMLSFMYDLPKSWDEVLASMSARTRKYHRGLQQDIVEKHSGQFLVGSKDLPADEAYTAVQRLHAGRFNAGLSTFLRPVAVDFHRQLARLWAPSGRVILPCIQLDGNIAAARYGFTHFGRYWDFQTGFDSAYSSISLGKMGMAWAMQCAIQQGLSIYDHLPGDQQHKRQRSTSSRIVLHIETFNPSSPRAMLFTTLRKIVRRIRQGVASGENSPQDTEISKSCVLCNK